MNDPSEPPADASGHPADASERPADAAAAAPTYRQAVPEDAVSIAALMAPDVRQRKLLRRTLEELMELTRHGFVALREDRMVGFCAVEIYSRKMAEIQCLVVDPSCRTQGIGRELVRRSVERARELGVMEVMAISSSEDFLRGCGFDYALPDQKRAMFCQLRSRYDSEEE